MRLKRLLSLIFISVFISGILSGCGQEDVAVPELLPTMAARDSYRPVEYGDIGSINVMFGSVVPTDSSYYWKTSASLLDITAEVGDYVEAGTVLANADIGTAREDIARFNRQINQENLLYNKDQEIYTVKHQDLEFASVIALSSGDKDSIDQAAENLAKLEENHRYDEQLHYYRIEQIKEEIDKKEELIEKEKLVAKTAGYVTYIKDLSKSNEASPYETIVVVSDYENCYIELPSVDMSQLGKGKIERFKRFYSDIDGIRYELKEIEYTPEEQVLFENKSLYPCARFEFAEGGQMPPIGTDIPIFMTVDASEHTLCVSNDSLLEDSQGTFVYVKEGDTKVTRYIEIGKRGKIYTEVISGLSEGEMVAYTTNILLMDEYDEYEVTSKVYEPTQNVKNYKKGSSLLDACYSEYNGRITSINATEGDTVKKGDEICQIKTEIGGASLKELSDAITALTEDYDVQIADCQDQIEAIYSQKVGCARQLNGSLGQLQGILDGGVNAQGTALTDAEIQGINAQMSELAKNAEYQQKRLELQTQMVELQKTRAKLVLDYQKQLKEEEYRKAEKGNDGHGLISIKAKQDGVISSSKMEEGKETKPGNRLFCIIGENKDSISFSTSKIMKIGQRVRMVSEDGSISYNATVIGMANPHRVYVTQDENDIHLTTISQDETSVKYTIVVDDSAFYEETGIFTLEFAEQVMEDVMVVPYRTVKIETIEGVDYEYVWRIIDGEPVKQYVTSISYDNTQKQDECILTGIHPGDIVAVEKEDE